MAQFQSYNKLLISKAEGIENYKVGDCVTGYIIRSQYPSYRGTYLSCIESFELYVDGERIPDNKIYFNLKGKQFLIDEFRDLYKEYWFILDKAKLLVLKDGGLEMGTAHEVEMKMRHKIPYTGYNGDYLSLDSDDKKELEVKGEVDAL